jgi:hypothetical protein
MTTSPTLNDLSSVELAPSYRIPLTLIGIALPIFFLQPILGLVLSFFGLFLLIQTLTIRLRFTPNSLDVYRSENLIRSFPYQEWQNWVIFWDKFPVLFYFKEVKSIHFLPIIFDAKALKSCLVKHYPLT